MLSRFFAALILVSAMTGCKEERAVTIQDPGPLESSFALYDSFAKTVGECNTLVVYEGLPHQTSESELLKKELATKETVEFVGFPFYRAPLTISGDDAVALKELYTSGRFTAYQGPKACGGFHPDYCAVWTDGYETVTVLVCFGCGEIKSVRGSDEFLCEMDDVRPDLEALLTKYRVNRPASKPAE